MSANKFNMRPLLKTLPEEEPNLDYKKAMFIFNNLQPHTGEDVPLEDKNQFRRYLWSIVRLKGSRKKYCTRSIKGGLHVYLMTDNDQSDRLNNLIKNK